MLLYRGKARHMLASTPHKTCSSVSAESAYLRVSREYVPVCQQRVSAECQQRVRTCVAACLSAPALAADATLAARFASAINDSSWAALGSFLRRRRRRRTCDTYQACKVASTCTQRAEKR